MLYETNQIRYSDAVRQKANQARIIIYAELKQNAEQKQNAAQEKNSEQVQNAEQNQNAEKNRMLHRK